MEKQYDCLVRHATQNKIAQNKTMENEKSFEFDVLSEVLLKLAGSASKWEGMTFEDFMKYNVAYLSEMKKYDTEERYMEYIEKIKPMFKQ